MPLPIDDLLNAANLVRAFRLSLNTASTVCRSCRSTRYDSWDEYKIATELEAIERKLRSVPGRLRIELEIPIDRFCDLCDISSEGDNDPPKKGEP